MVRKTELEQLRIQKELLALQCDANRLILSAEWEQLQSREYWLARATSLARQHPLKAAALAAATGLLVTHTVAKPAVEGGWLGRLSRGVSMAASVWKFFDRKKPEP
jgi:hypothetical protein